MPVLEVSAARLAELTEVQGDLFGVDPRARMEFNLRDKRFSTSLRRARAERSEAIMEVLDKIKWMGDAQLQRGNFQDAKDSYQLYLSYMAPKLNGVIVQQPGTNGAPGSTMTIAWQNPPPEDNRTVEVE